VVLRLLVARVSPPLPLRLGLAVDRLAARLVDLVEGLLVEDLLVEGLRVEDLAAALPAVLLVDLLVAEELPERAGRVRVVLVLAGRPGSERPVAVPTRRLTSRVRSSIRLVSRSTSAWLAVLFSRLWTCWRLAWIAF
jgi:hypothetical protein